VHQDAHDQPHALMGTPEFDKSRDERKRVEMRFARLKSQGCHRRLLRLRSGEADRWREWPG
jgi:hypothetical protein